MVRTTLLTIGIVAFVLSFLLPAYYDQKGYECAWECLKLLTTHPGDLVWLYYVAFNLSNLFMIVVPLICIAKTSFRAPAWLRIIQFLLFFHVFSWLVVNRMSGEFDKVQVGYYLWAFSMVCALIVIQKNWFTKRLIDTDNDDHDPRYFR